MTSPYMQLLELQQRLTKLWVQLSPGRASSAEFSNAPLSEDALVTFTADLDQVEQVVMSASRRRELLALTPLGRDILKDEDVATFADTKPDPKAKRRHELLSLTQLGRDVLREEAERKAR